MPVAIAVSVLAAICDPFENPWTGEKFSVEDVRQAVSDGRFLKSSWGASSAEWSRNDHIERVAYLVVSPDRTPVEIDVGIPSLGVYVAWPLTDGNHRLGAAVVRGDPHILAIVSGSVDHAERLLGASLPEDD